MKLSEHLPFWDKLTGEEQKELKGCVRTQTIPAGTHIYSSAQECLGLLILIDGQLRVYILSEEGREVTLYRLLQGDTCLFSASCIFHSVQFDLAIVAEKETTLYLIPFDKYKALMERSVVISNYTNEIMATRMSEVMWLIKQIMWQSFDKRLASFLLEERGLNQSDALRITHEQIAGHLGTAREVVTRMLKYFQQEGWVTLTRGNVTILDDKVLSALAKDS